MTKTENYNLNQWVPEDPVRRTDFNEDNAKLDAALKAQADALAAEAAARENAVAAEAQARQSIAAQVAGRGNCQIITGSYTGSGAYGAASSRSLTFPGNPLFVTIYPAAGAGRDLHLTMVQGVTWTDVTSYTPGASCTVAWKTNGVSWYANSAENQMNTSNTKYQYVALLAADAT